MKAGTAVYRDDDPSWRAVVLGSNAQGVRIRWTSGPLRGKEGLVPAGFLRREKR